MSGSLAAVQLAAFLRATHPELNETALSFFDTDAQLTDYVTAANYPTRERGAVQIGARSACPVSHSFLNNSLLPAALLRSGVDRRLEPRHSHLPILVSAPLPAPSLHARISG